jgi:RNA polymerase sigma-70 factor (ECF subfamily)
MEMERALPSPPSALSRRLLVVAAREHGVGAEQLRWIGTDPDLFEAFYREHVEGLQRFVARRVGDRERAGEERLRGSALLDEEDAARMDARLDAAAQSRRLYEAMDRLPEVERAVLELVALDELTVAEAAAAAGVRPVTARVRLHRARRKLRDELDAAATQATQTKENPS